MTQPLQPKKRPAESPSQIVVVDDEPMIGEIVETLLTMEGFQVRLFLDPKQAWKAFQSGGARPDLLLTDFTMPGLNGMELIERCKQAEPSLKTILFSGAVDETILERYSIRPDRFLRKPFQSRSLVSAIKTLLKKAERAGRS